MAVTTLHTLIRANRIGALYKFGYSVGEVDIWSYKWINFGNNVKQKGFINDYLLVLGSTH